MFYQNSAMTVCLCIFTKQLRRHLRSGQPSKPKILACLALPRKRSLTSAELLTSTVFCSQEKKILLSFKLLLLIELKKYVILKEKRSIRVTKKLEKKTPVKPTVVTTTILVNYPSNFWMQLSFYKMRY